MSLRVLDPTRHRCLACGSSCHGHRVRLLDDEGDRMRAVARDLGVHDPIDGPWLRHEEGRCVFLAADGLCSIHARKGFDAKPRLCQQYPWLALQIGTDQRIGLDPGCATAWESWSDGPEAAPGALVARGVESDEDDLRAEGALIAATLQPWSTMEAVFTFLANGRTHQGAPWPAGFAERCRDRVFGAGLAGLLRREDTGGPVRDALLPVVEHAQQGRPLLAGPLPLASDEWGREVLRRVLFLRVFHPLPVPAASLLVFVGAVLIGGLDPAPAVFCPRLALWTRAARATPFWTALLGDGAATLQLVGAREG